MRRPNTTIKVPAEIKDITHDNGSVTMLYVCGYPLIQFDNTTYDVSISDDAIQRIIRDIREGKYIKYV